jgi:hypothetical protein
LSFASGGYILVFHTLLSKNAKQGSAQKGQHAIVSPVNSSNAVSSKNNSTGNQLFVAIYLSPESIRGSPVACTINVLRS